MSYKYNYSEMIDAYLEGKMSVGEMQEFELQLKKDPIMENEFQLQKDIVSSLKEYRKAELKARFEGINVGSPWMGAGFNAVNIGLSVVLTSLIGVGVFFYANRENEGMFTIAGAEKATETIQKEEVPSLVPIKPELSSEKGTKMAEIIPPAADSHEKAVKQTASQKDAVSSKVKATVSGPNINPAVGQPNIVEFENETIASGESIQLPENTLSDLGNANPAPLEVEKKEDKKHHFHYQYYNSKLYLYGDFKNIPYELIEVNNSSGKMLYMYYKDDFYYIQDAQMRIAPLKKISDTKLIAELNELRLAK